MKTLPTVSVGLPVYNGARYLQRAIRSILDQDFEDLELIISDNASTDETEAICRKMAAGDARINYSRNEINFGAARNYNKVFKLSKGKYFKWATHDDICLPGFLSECVKVLDSNSDSVVLVYTQAAFIDEKGDFLGKDSDYLETKNKKIYKRLSHVLKNLNMANAIFGLFRSDTLKKTRLIDSFIASDYVLLAEIAMLGEIWEINRQLYLRRLHGGASRYANRTNKDVQSWFAPDKNLKIDFAHILFPRAVVRLRLLFEWMKSIFRIPLSTTERFVCLITLPTAYGVARARDYGGLWKMRIRGWVGRQ